MRNDFTSNVTINPSSEMFSDEELIKKRFSFHLAVSKNYINHMQKVEGKSYEETKENVMKLANNLVERFHFGSKFISEIDNHLKIMFRPAPVSFKNNIIKDAEIDDPNLFNFFMDDLKNSADFENLSPRFRTIL